MKKIINWWKKKHGHKYINGGKGVISIFLIIVMLPFAYFADWLVEGARYHSSVSLLDEAIDSANLSVMSNYDQYLYERFGILTVDNNINLSEEFDIYLRANTASLGSWSINETSATGMYALSDNEILLKQVAEFSQYGATAALVSDLGLSELISTLEKMTQLTDIFKIITGVGKTADACLTLADSVVELQEFMKDFEKHRDTYVEKYNAFAAKYGELVNAIEVQNQKNREVSNIEKKISESKATAEANELIGQTEKELELLENQKENGEISEEEYETLKKEKEEKLEEYKKQLEDALEEDEELQKELKNARTELSNANATVENAKISLTTAKAEYSQAIDVMIDDLEEYQTKADKVIEGVSSCMNSAIDLGTEIAKTEAANESKQEELKKDQDELSKKIASESDENKKAEYIEAKEEMGNQMTDLKASSDNVKATGTVAKKEVSYLADSVEQTMEEYRKEEIENYVSKLRKIKERVDSLQITNITVNSNFQKELYYVEISDGIISESTLQLLIESIENNLQGSDFWDIVDAFSVALRSLFSTQLIFDSRLTAYIKEDSGYSASTLDLILNDFSALLQVMDKANNSILPMLTILTNIKNIIDSVKSLMEHLLEYLSGMVSRAVISLQEILSEKCGEKILLSEYMVKTLSSRTNADVNGKITGKNILTGYNFSNVKFAGSGHNEIPIIGDIDTLIELFRNIQDGGEDIMFSGAELEYILVGSRSEIINQAAAFFQIYFLRLILSMGKVFTNKEVAAIADTAAAASVGIGGVVVYILYLLVEPLIETILIVNGKKISLCNEVVYFTPSGSVTLVSRLTNLGLKSTDRKEIENKMSVFTAQTKISGCATKDSDGICWKYENYLFFLMLVFIDTDTSMDRFKNIVTLEAKAFYGEEDFDLENAYTYIEGKVTGRFDPVLPLGGITTNSIFEQHRSRMRGY